MSESGSTKTFLEQVWLADQGVVTLETVPLHSLSQVPLIGDVTGSLCMKDGSRGEVGSGFDRLGHPKQLVVAADPPHQRRPDW
jgi:hypothetical protein